MSIKVMQREILSQPEQLPRYASYLRKLPPCRFSPSKMVFAGSGDSYAASLFAEQLTGGEARAFDPAELFSRAETARAKAAILVSVSGRTKANARLARRLKGIARKTIAVTANPKSPLASLCDEVLELQYSRSNILTSGTISFTETILAVSYLLGKLPRNLELSKSFGKALRVALPPRVPPNGDFYFVGSGVNKALAEYGACKVHEVLGAKAVASFPEQLGHAGLFSVDRERDTVVSVQTGGASPVARILRALKDGGYRTLSIIPRSPSVIVLSLEVCFSLQQLVLDMAKRRGMRDCAFLSDPARLMLSNKLIY